MVRLKNVIIEDIKLCLFHCWLFSD